jgi:hypothetical protein
MYGKGPEVQTRAAHCRVPTIHNGRKPIVAGSLRTSGGGMLRGGKGGRGA